MSTRDHRDRYDLAGLTGNRKEAFRKRIYRRLDRIEQSEAGATCECVSVSGIHRERHDLDRDGHCYFCRYVSD